MTPAQENGRTRCEIYTRVMGYYRPVSHFNNGKKSEFYSRTNFHAGESMNSQFVAQYGTGCGCESACA